MRRRELAGATGALLLAGATRARAFTPDPRLPAGTREIARLASLPGKRDLIELADRPLNYETPADVFRTAITPDDRFFVRYHLAEVPDMAELRNWKLTVGGDAAGRSLTFTLDELKRDFPHAEVTAVCQCSGNRRGLFDPNVAGVQWGVGAMGCARWSGVRLRDVLERVGVKPEAIEVAMNGADGPVITTTPDFIKSIPLEKAQHPDTLIAWEMNGKPLPHFNGYPARVIVPGWTATYWMKHVTSIELRSKPEDSFWMKAAYRVPRGLFPTDMPFRSQQTEANEPITQIMVNSLVANLHGGEQVKAGGFEVEGVAWDGGHGIRTVEISLDGGRRWQPARLGEDLGPYAFRTFRARIVPGRPGPVRVMVRATSNAGQTQVEKLVPNPAGYQHNVIQTLALEAVA